MPEETNTAVNTSNTPAEGTQAVEPTTPTATEQNPAPEANKGQEPQPAEPKPAEPELTIDSYKDLGFDGFEEEFIPSEEELKAFKQLGVDNKIAPQALKAISVWSMTELKKQKEATAKIVEGWRAENAKKYGDNLKNVQTNVGRVLAQMDKSGNFANLLKTAGAEEHPATLEFLSAIGDVLLEKGSVNPNATVQGKEFTLEDMYKQKTN